MRDSLGRAMFSKLNRRERYEWYCALVLIPAAGGWFAYKEVTPSFWAVLIGVLLGLACCLALFFRDDSIRNLEHHDLSGGSPTANYDPDQGVRHNNRSNGAA